MPKGHIRAAVKSFFGIKAADAPPRQDQQGYAAPDAQLPAVAAPRPATAEPSLFVHATPWRPINTRATAAESPGPFINSKARRPLSQAAAGAAPVVPSELNGSQAIHAGDFDSGSESCAVAILPAIHSAAGKTKPLTAAQQQAISYADFTDIFLRNQYNLTSVLDDLTEAQKQLIKNNTKFSSTAGPNDNAYQSLLEANTWEELNLAIEEVNKQLSSIDNPDVQSYWQIYYSQYTNDVAKLEPGDYTKKIETLSDCEKERDCQHDHLKPATPDTAGPSGRKKPTRPVAGPSGAVLPQPQPPQPYGPKKPIQHLARAAGEAVPQHLLLGADQTDHLQSKPAQPNGIVKMDSTWL